MMITRRTNLLPLLLSVWLLTGLGASRVSAAIQVLDDSPSRLTITVTTQDWELVETDDGILPSPFGAGIDERRGGVQVPFYRRLIGLPADAAPHVQITEVRWGDTVEGNLPQGSEDVENSRVPRLIPNRLVTFGEPYTWRGRWVTDMYIVPVMTEGKRIRLLESATISLTYPAPKAALQRSNDPMAADFLLNPNASANWAIRKSGRSILNAAEAWPSGEMYRIETTMEGIYRISREDLENAGIDLSGFDPRTFRIYGNGGMMLPEPVHAERDSVLRENAIVVVGEEDGSWDEGDYILFYGRGVISWKASKSLPGTYAHTQNLYSRNNVYWLNVADDGSLGRRMVSANGDESPTFIAEYATSRLVVDNDAFVFYSDGTPESGKSWYAADLQGGGRYSSTFTVDSPVTDMGAQVRTNYKRVYNGDGGIYYGVITINGTLVDTVNVGVSNQMLPVPPNVLREGSNTFTFTLLNGRCMFDYYEVIYPRHLRTTGNRMEFDALPDAGVAEIELEGLTEPWIFDVEQFDSVRVTRDNPFTLEASFTKPNRIIAVADGAFLNVSSIQPFYRGWGEYETGLRRANHTADAIFILHPDFAGASAELEAYVEERDQLEVMRVRTTDIYNEFGWGLMDPSAIRDFLKFARDHWTGATGSPPTVCLLIGDGDYDYRNIVSSSDKNWVPPHEDGLQCRDDWYATFSSDADAEYIMGRLPFQLASELEGYIDRLITYENDINRGPWRSKVIMVADDEYVATGPTGIDKQHIRFSEQLAAGYVPEYMQTEKIYIGTYPTNFDPTTGARIKPLATDDLIATINRGALLINYMGHGNAHVWAHENLLMDSRDLPKINSGSREPIYVAATCSWGYFDRPENEAFFERLLAQPGGAIGVMAATRNTSGGGNNAMVQKFYQLFFDREEPRTLGECLFLAKVQTSGITNKYYHCFSDPLMMPAVPRLDLVVQEIDPDSLISMRTAGIRGSVQGLNGTVPIEDFQGEALVTVYDSYDSLIYEFFDGSEFTYRTPGGIMFRGNVGVYDSDFNAQFMVPKDVNYGSTDGWVVLYGTGEERDAIGSRRGLHISSVFPSPADITDHTPPEVEVYFNHRGWLAGDLTNSQPILIVDLADSSGINLTGEIGHDIKVTLDPGTTSERSILLNEDFVYERDSYTNGSAERMLGQIEPGQHELEIRAWDNANNMAMERIQFTTAADEGDLMLRNVFNVPNPFKGETHFTFETMRADEVTIRIYTPSGRHIKTIGPVSVQDNFNYVAWDGLDQYGDEIGNGVYLYTVKVSNSAGQSQKAVGKLLRIR